MGSEMLYSGRKQEDVKSNFSQTCSRLSQFLKERRALGQQLDAFKSIASSELEIKGNKNVYGAKNVAINPIPKTTETERMSFELFPMMTTAGVENLTKNMADSREMPLPKEETKNATTPSMTIFYGGRVLVFNELPEDKAREIMSLACCGTMISSTQTQIQTQTQSKIQHRINTVTTQLAQDVVSQRASSLSDLPLARRVSLHRFMEKRKHRIAASAPYQLQNSSMATSDPHPQKFNMMKNLFEQQQLELKL